MSNEHGCRFGWCVNGLTDLDGVDLEHFSSLVAVPMTGDSLAKFGRSDWYPRDEFLLTVGVGIHYNEDLEAAPGIALALHGGPDALEADYTLTIAEAAMLHAALGQVIRDATAGTHFDPDRLLEFHAPAFVGPRAEGER